MGLAVGANSSGHPKNAPSALNARTHRTRTKGFGHDIIPTKPSQARAGRYLQLICSPQLGGTRRNQTVGEMAGTNDETNPTVPKGAGKRAASSLESVPKRAAMPKRARRPEIWTKRNGSTASAIAGLEWEHQFRQNKSIPTALHGVACGSNTLGCPYVPSQYPSPDEMRFEIMTGIGSIPGSIKLYGPRDYWPGDDPVLDACFVVPVANIGKSAAVIPHALKLANSYSFSMFRPGYRSATAPQFSITRVQSFPGHHRPG